jgi:aspartyl-tRNA(Asn)/glutamyl-tRNA(Gln) amidotransferase subunit A
MTRTPPRSICRCPDYEAALGGSVKGLKIGIPREYRMEGMPDEIEALWQQGIAWLRDAGAEIVDIELPHTKYALPAYYIVAPAEASSNLARYDGVRYGLRVPGKDIADMYEKTRAEGFGQEVKRRIMIGTYVLSAGYYDAYYLRAQKVRTLIKRDFELAFEAGVDAILTPATPSSAFRRGRRGSGQRSGEDVPQRHFHRHREHGRPSGHRRPAGLDPKGLPLGLQLIGRPFEEETLFKTAHVIEQAAGRFEPKKWW